MESPILGGSWCAVQGRLLCRLMVERIKRSELKRTLPQVLLPCLSVGPFFRFFVFACPPYSLCLSFYQRSARSFSVLCFLREMMKSYDFICLQETGLGTDECLAIPLFAGWKVFTSSKAMGVAGVLVLCSPLVGSVYDVSSHEVGAEFRGHLQALHCIPKVALSNFRAFDLFHVYFPSAAGEEGSGSKFSIITNMLDFLATLPVLPTFMVGDFNFVEAVEDASGARAALPPKLFLDRWSNFKDLFALAEAHQDCHTFFRRVSGGGTTRFLSSRLDRIYIPASLLSCPVSSPTAAVVSPSKVLFSSLEGALGSSGPRGFSDHVPVALSFIETGGSAVEARPSVPKWVTEHAFFCDEVEALWAKLVVSPNPFRALLQLKSCFYRAAAVVKKDRFSRSQAIVRYSVGVRLLNAVSRVPQDLVLVRGWLNDFDEFGPYLSFSDGCWKEVGLQDYLDLLLTTVGSYRRGRRKLLSILSKKIFRALVPGWGAFVPLLMMLY